MLTLEKLKNKIENCKEPKLIVTVVVLPTGALETLVNTEFLKEKLDYILNAYDENLNLKTCPSIKLMDCIIL